MQDWYANNDKARSRLGWQPRTSFRDGFQRTVDWYRGLPDKAKYHQSSKKFGLDSVYSVSAIIACYKDNLAIPIMYERLKATFTKVNIDFEIIFVNDCSPDDTEEVIRGISRNDRRVLGISHSRNFGSQSAFRSGMEIASKNACVLLDGDLQDPPELIEQFVKHWREGYDVVYGRRVKREASLFMQFAYKAFYRVFDYFSYIRIPHDAGDFSLMDRRVVQAILHVPRARPLPPRGARLRRVQADRRRLRPARADVRRHHQQPAQEHRLGEEGDPQLQQYAAEHSQRCGDHPPRHLRPARPGAEPGSPARPPTRPAGRHDDPDPHPVLRGRQSLRDRPGRRIHRQDLRRSQTKTHVHSKERNPAWRGTSGDRRPADGRWGGGAVTEPLDRPNLVVHRSEAWRPPTFRRVNTRMARIAAAARRGLDLQAASIWRDLLALLSPIQGDVLDVGCGAQPYRELFHPQANYRAIDSAGAEHNFGYAIPDTTYYEGDCWPIDKASIDVILCTETLEHVPDPSVFLAEAARCLRPGGWLLLTVPFAARWHYIPHDYWRFTPSGLQRLLGAAGFEQIAVFARATR